MYKYYILIPWRLQDFEVALQFCSLRLQTNFFKL